MKVPCTLLFVRVLLAIGCNNWASHQRLHTVYEELLHEELSVLFQGIRLVDVYLAYALANPA